MKLLPTSGGVTNDSLREALVDLLSASRSIRRPRAGYLDRSARSSDAYPGIGVPIRVGQQPVRDDRTRLEIRRIA